MKILRLFLVTLSLGLSVSCKKHSAKIYDQLYKMEMAYSTNDIRAAERSLLDYLKLLSQEESNSVKGLDYDMGRAITHARLFLIYRKLGDTNNVELHFREWLENLGRFDKRNNLPPPELTQEILAEKMDRFDKDLNVRWKTNTTITR